MFEKKITKKLESDNDLIDVNIPNISNKQDNGDSIAVESNLENKKRSGSVLDKASIFAKNAKPVFVKPDIVTTNQNSNYEKVFDGEAKKVIWKEKSNDPIKTTKQDYIEFNDSTSNHADNNEIKEKAIIIDQNNDLNNNSSEGVQIEKPLEKVEFIINQIEEKAKILNHPDTACTLEISDNVPKDFSTTNDKRTYEDEIIPTDEVGEYIASNHHEEIDKPTGKSSDLFLDVGNYGSENNFLTNNELNQLQFNFKSDTVSKKKANNNISELIDNKLEISINNNITPHKTDSNLINNAQTNLDNKFLRRFPNADDDNLIGYCSNQLRLHKKTILIIAIAFILLFIMIQLIKG